MWSMEAQEAYRKATEAITAPWPEMVRRKQSTRSPHWNTKIKTLWDAMRKARIQACRSDLVTDRDTYRAKRKRFQKENRSARRRFERRTEARLRHGGNGVVTEAIRTDTKRREKREREQTSRGDPLNPADFTRFMGAHHDQRQERITLQPFDVPENFTGELIKSIRRSRNNKAPGRDGVHNEMLKLEPGLIAELLGAVWRIIGRSMEYPELWGEGLLAPIYKKGDRVQPENYRPVCMISCARKIVETAIAEAIAKKLKVCGRQFGFEKGLSPSITLKDVDTLVRGRQSRITTLDLTKAYDKVNRRILLEDCDKVLSKGTLAMFSACLQVLRVSSKGDVLGETAEIRLGLPQGTPLSPVLLIIYINDLPLYCRRWVDYGVQTHSRGRAEISLTADDVILHTDDWGGLIEWLDACGRWSCKKGMRWESSKCTVICRT